MTELTRKWTGGEWELIPRTDKDDDVKSFDILSPWQDNQRKRIATLDAYYGLEEAQANAHILTAAPELFEALWDAYDVFMADSASGSFTCTCGECGPCEVKLTVKAALQAALGEGEER